ncbi:glycoside hydrolase/deacetylase [Aspergillus sclerotioniger CBS 115572]|uniref:Glycoside hydrolase/deacetylase n=1 Tax=Aspergillus sclerotioniger CBS 115572 TaxID=1450535 RepID=A0A317WLG8_9EURO|nr:glycoside hydrolase/deacetylase [Aspergillus sclerotioniger CBS 115572]PWY87179.1 glycoside hydrolase/deacetylase [Aspergillus sclerotioniger CBS 115572]
MLLITLNFLLLTIITLLQPSHSHPHNQTDPYPPTPYATVITHCAVPGTIALTFDDGPYTYTPALLDLLSEYGARSTFFLNGYRLTEYTDVLQRIFNEGHQIASHTYGHTHLPSLDYASIVNEMGALESLFRNIIGVVPTYMRPPFLAVDGRVLAVMAELGYNVVGASVDTKDFENNDPWLIYESVRRFLAGVDAGGSIVLAHDTHAQTVFTLTRAMLEEVARRGLYVTTVADCLGDTVWYR